MGNINMNQDERRLRRYRLGSLHRKRAGVQIREAYLNALGTLEERAIGEDILSGYRTKFSEFRKSLSCADMKPGEIREHLSWYASIYLSRACSFQQFAAFVEHVIQNLHESNIMSGVYDKELNPIREKLRVIEKEYGLGGDEYWAKGDGPKEYERLEKKFERVLDKRYLGILREYELDIVANLLENDPKEYERIRERGRRSLFYKEEKEQAIKDVVEQYVSEAQKSAKAKAYSAAVLSLGVAVEGLLLLRCLRSKSKSRNIAKSLAGHLRPRNHNDPTTWSFETLIEVCEKAKWLPDLPTKVAVFVTSSLAHQLRKTRNFVHPGRRIKSIPWIETEERDYEDAEAIYIVLRSSLDKRSKWGKLKSERMS